MSWEKRLSLCLITKDDEKHLADCLQDMKGAVDEIIVADIGSSDRTIEIAEQAGAKVYQVKWENNYSAVKNFCMDHAIGRWVLFLQANETIPADQVKELGSLLDNPNAEGYLLYADYPSENCRVYSPAESLCLLRNRREYRYQYKVFAHIPDEILTNIDDSGVRIIKRDDLNPSREYQSDILLLEEELKEHPEDAYLQYMHGIELLNGQRYEESIASFQSSLKYVNYDFLYAPHLLKCLSWSFIYLQRHSKALEVLEEGIKTFPFYTDFLVLRGELYKQLEQYDEAIRDLEGSLKILEESNFIIPAPEIEAYIIMEMLGEIHEKLFNYQQALAYCLEAYKSDKNNDELLNEIIGLAEKAGYTELPEELLRAVCEQNNPEQAMVTEDL